LLFLIASAIVSFKGWPQVGAPSSPVAVNVSATASGASAPSRAVVAALTTAVASTRAPVAGRGGAASGRQRSFSSGPVPRAPAHRSPSGGGSAPSGGSGGSGGSVGSGSGGGAGPV